MSDKNFQKKDDFNYLINNLKNIKKDENNNIYKNLYYNINNNNNIDTNIDSNININNNIDNNNNFEVTRRHSVKVTNIPLFSENQINLDDNKNKRRNSLSGLTSSNLFCYQELDKYSTLNDEDSRTPIYSTEDVKSNSCSSSSSDNEDEEDDDNAFYKKIKQKKEKRKSAFYHNNLFNQILNYSPSSLINNNNNNYNSNNNNNNNSFLQNRNKFNNCNNKSNILFIPSKDENPFQNFLNNISKEPNNKNNNNNSYNDLFSNLLSSISDQIKSRQLQSLLEEKKDDINFLSKFFEKIKLNLSSLTKHQFGNYVIQKYFEILLNKNIKILLKKFFLSIADNLYEISIDNYGSRFFQNSLDKLKDGKYSIIDSNEINNIFKNLIENNIMKLCNHKDGNFVFQKINKIFPKNKNNFIYESLIIHACEISQLTQGAAIMKNSIEIANEKQKEKLILKILDNIDILINSQFGNFTLQIITDLKEYKYNKIVYDYIKNNVLDLSKKKFSSNVIDKCIIKNYDLSIDLAKFIIDNKFIGEMIVDQYANYTVQKILKIVDMEYYQKCVNQIKPCLDILLKTQKGSKVYEKLKEKNIFQ
jgi:pumilio RNA-binding family